MGRRRFLQASLVVLALACTRSAAAQAVISQVYADGGLYSSTYTHDFVEIFNRGAASIDLTGWAIRYKQYSFAPWSVTSLSGSLPPGRYYLVQLFGTSHGGQPLPPPDAVGSTDLASSGSIELTDASWLVVDTLGYGSLPPFYEELPFSGALGYTAAAFRKSAGCQDIGNNAFDFESGAPFPYNSASPPKSCAGIPVPTNPSCSSTATPSPVAPEGLLLLVAQVAPGTNPPSTGLAVAADLTAIGGSSAAGFYDDGTHGDQVAGDGFYSLAATVAQSTPLGLTQLEITVTDGEQRRGVSAVDLRVVAPAQVVTTGVVVGRPGGLIEIKGTGLGTGGAGNGVWIGALALAPDSWSDTLITATIPLGAASGPLLLCVYGIQVKVADLLVAYTVVPGDFDGDGKADVAVYRPSTGTWFSLNSSTGNTTYTWRGWGMQVHGDMPVRGDFDGDGTADPVVYRPGPGTWFILKSGSRFTTWEWFGWGQATDIVVPGDYDGDGRTDGAVYRPSTGRWYIRPSSGAPQWSVVFGRATDVPVPGDYDGDGQTDVAVYRPAYGTWFVLTSSSNYKAWWYHGWGMEVHGDTPAPGDYDGDGKTDLCVFRPGPGTWFILESHANRTTWSWFGWGTVGDQVVPADYDGDGKTDAAVYRPSTGRWYVRPSSGAPEWSVVFGAAGDVPLQGIR